MGVDIASIGPLYGGILAGVLHTVLGPDHISTIVTLSACQGVDAFWFGVRWAGGHMAGMVVIGCAFYAINTWPPSLTLRSHKYGDVGFEAYEHYVDYVIGCMLVLCGTYFLLNADKYFDEEWKPKTAGCSCHAHLCSPGHAGEGHLADEDPSGSTGERQPLQPRKRAGDDNGRGMRGAGSVLVGFVQGVACPAGLVGFAFLKEYAGNYATLILFVATFFAASTLAMGGLAMAYGVLTERCVTSASLGRCIYCGSCVLSIVVGLAWIILNATGYLEALLGHHHDHGHGEHHHAEHASAEQMMLMLISPR
mmetsp:Transcript_83078/g.232833  ORF Transcript_83078/g.232833 Transcript_83078/m.232833 type:complete len:308 (-) Transcript_83078:114-1037(-)